MSSSGRAGNGRADRKKPFRRRNSDAWQNGDSSGRISDGDSHSDRSQAGASVKGNNHYYKKSGEVRGDRVSFTERPRWIPPRANTDPLPVSECLWCGKPIRDISTAIADKDTGGPVHFDCVAARTAFGEKLEKGESVAYIGAGRFGIVSFGNVGAPSRFSPSGSSQNTGKPDTSKPENHSEVHDHTLANRGFTIRKIIEWENKDKRAEWRSVICDHYSVT
jgi:hypothetical protein